ncbi:MAG: hypothetical protein IPK39_11790, partial [Sulfuritalea sp.]|nr:hypothetical protein [Sulfuritalea sp.]
MATSKRGGYRPGAPAGAVRLSAGRLCTAIALVLVLRDWRGPPTTQIVFGDSARLRLPAPLRAAPCRTSSRRRFDGAGRGTSNLIVSFALTVAAVTLVSSFRTAVDRWLDVVLPRRCYVRSKGVPLPRELLLGALANLRPLREGQ